MTRLSACTAFALLSIPIFIAGLACSTVNRYANYELTNPIEAHDTVCGDCHKLYPATYYCVDDWRTFLAKHPKAHRPKPEVMEAIIEYILQDALVDRDDAEESL